jgi:tetratricopeptide (TPR) repeat protein
MTVRLLASLLALVAIHAASIAAQQTPASRGGKDAAAERALQAAFDAYAGGDDLAAGRWVAGLEDASVLRNVGAFVARQPWSRSGAAFLLEVVVATPSVGRLPQLLADAQAVLAKRPTPLGGNAEEDRFEVLWHQAAIGTLQALPMVEMLQQYLDAIAPRFAEAAGRGVTLETRFALARGFTAALVCCWERRPFEIVRQIPRAARGATTRDAALAIFDRAATESALRVEALVRAGKLLHEAGRYKEALARFAEVPDHDDPVIAYVQHLTEARALDALDRPAEAATAYRAALATPPPGQTAGIGLAAALLRSGQIDDAVRAADEARSMGNSTQGHLVAFNRGDQRFVSRWLAEIRTLRR